MSKKKELLFSVSIKDCVVQTFRAGGKGGQHQNTTDSGVRVIHKSSGARGEARDCRHQLQNKRNAFKRMASTKKFQSWVKIHAAKLAGKPTLEELVEKEMQSQNIKIEIKDLDGSWVIGTDII